MSKINLMTGNYDMELMKPYYERESKKVSEGQKVDDESLTLAGQTKTNYLELAIGDREKELEKLGLLENEDGKVLLKKNGLDKESHEAIAEDEDKNESEEGECETCANRKYQDGSNEADVSFKAATHISPNAAASAVLSHEKMHVSNAYQKASLDNGKVVSATVNIHTSVCPECGRSYVSGGTTRTQIKYYNEENPYQKNLKTTDSIKYKGRMVDLWS